VRIEIHLGTPIQAEALRERSRGDRQVMMDAIGLSIAAMLPPGYRGAYRG
jgi:hypothetical protein